jgi:hypothetical protein
MSARQTDEFLLAERLGNDVLERRAAIGRIGYADRSIERVALIDRAQEWAQGRVCRIRHGCI